MNIVRINNRDNFLFQDIPTLHPDSLKYLEYWKIQKRRCIEGYWGQDTKDTEEKGMWRFMPPQLYFYVNFCKILHKPEGQAKTAARKKINPNLDDIDWDFFYKFLEIRGFSGFSDDDLYTCCEDVRDANPILPDSVFNSNGDIKQYVSVREYIMQLFDTPLGIPLYENEAKNLMMLGSRGGGKSYWVADGVVLHSIIFDGATKYDQESIENPAKIEVFVGAAIAAKSSELLQKTTLGFTNLPGTWKTGTIDEIPAPFYKKMAGNLLPNNIKNPWRHEYEKKIGGEWKTAGSGSLVKHGIWTTENPEAAAGGRYSVVVCEEVGLTPNILTIHGSNDAVTRIEHKFGSSVYLGTGGNMEKIIESEIIFRDPAGFEMLEFDDIWEGMGKIGYFIPVNYADRRFKDENGNTKIDEAKNSINKEENRKRIIESFRINPVTTLIRRDVGPR